MSIDPEFDPFLRSAPLDARFYTDMQLLLSRKQNSLIEQYEAENEIPVPDFAKQESFLIFEPDIRTSCVLGNIDSIECADLADQRAHPNQKVMPEPFVAMQFYAYSQNAYYVRPADNEWLVSQGASEATDASRAYYLVLALPEHPPLLIIRDAYDLVAEKWYRESGTGYTNIPTVDHLLLLRAAKYEPYILQPDECEALQAAYSQSRPSAELTWEVNLEN